MELLSKKRNSYYGGKYCQGICDDIKEDSPFGSGYTKGLTYCSRCEAYLKKETLKPHESKGHVCPCCNFRPRFKSKNKKVNKFEGY